MSTTSSSSNEPEGTGGFGWLPRGDEPGAAERRAAKDAGSDSPPAPDFSALLAPPSRRADPITVQTLINWGLVGLLCIVGALVALQTARTLHSHPSGALTSVTPTADDPAALAPTTVPHTKPTAAPATSTTRVPAPATTAATTPKTTPQTVPETTPRTTPQTSPRTTPQTTPRTTPVTVLQVPSTTPVTTPGIAVPSSPTTIPSGTIAVPVGPNP